MKGAITMSVLTRDDFFNRVQTVVGTDTSDEMLSFIEDMTDTYNDLDGRANGDGVDWEQRYHDLDESWKAKYKQRFFSGGGSARIPQEEHIDESKGNDSIGFDDLFN